MPAQPPRSAPRYVAIAALVLATAALVLSWRDLPAQPLRGDEALIMSASDVLAHDGRLGSDLAAGFAGADRAFFLNLPLQNVLQAAVFRGFGVGVWQARVPSWLLAASLLMLVVSLVAATSSLEAGVAAASAMLLWRSNLIGVDARTPLVALAQSARYDIAVAAMVWGTMLLWLRAVCRPSPLRAALCGAAAAMALLAQFYGGMAFVVVLVVATLVPGARRRLAPCVGWGLGALTAVLLPYAAFVVAHRQAFVQQLAIQGPRLGVWHASFWIDNLWREPARYAPLLGAGAPWTVLARPTGWALALAAVGAAVAVRRAWRRRTLRAVTAAAVIVVPPLVIALVEQTKAPLYASAVLPSLAAAFGGGVAALVWTPGPPWWRGAARAVVAALLAVLALDAWHGLQRAHDVARAATPYDRIATTLATATGPDDVIAGPWRWWWALRARRYRAVPGLWSETARDAAGPSRGSFAGDLAGLGATFVLVDRDLLADLGRMREPYRADALAFLEACTVQVRVVDDRTYGVVALRRLNCASP